MVCKLVLLVAAAWLTVMLAHHSDARHNAPKDSDWESYKKFHGKSYRDEHHHKRSKEIFDRKVQQITEHNKRFANGEIDYELEINSFTDLDEASLQKRRGLKPPSPTAQSQAEQGTPSDVPAGPRRARRALAASFDWRTYGAVSPVKDQGQCGCCWSFSATGALEGAQFLKTKTMNLFSEQQIIDCDTVDGGCNGGNPINAWNYIKTAGGVVSEAAYPFNSGTTETAGTCAKPAATATKQTLTKWVVLPANETAIQQALVTYGPLSMIFDASNLNSYSSGIYNCPANFQVDHAVLIVGYGADSTGKPYWIVKNQWGTSWGMNGYFYLARGSNACGVTTQVAYTVI